MMSCDSWSKTSCISLIIYVVLIPFYLTSQKSSNHSIFNIHLLYYLILCNADKEKGKYVLHSPILLHNSCMKFNEMEFSFEVLHTEVLGWQPVFMSTVG
jgi:hypothetical protein